MFTSFLKGLRSLILFLVGISLSSVILSFLFFIVEYRFINTVIIISMWSITCELLSIQLTFKSLKLFNLKKWQITYTIILLYVFLFLPILANYLNRVITVSSNFDSKVISSDKINILNSFVAEDKTLSDEIVFINKKHYRHEKNKELRSYDSKEYDGITIYYKNNFNTESLDAIPNIINNYSDFLSNYFTVTYPTNLDIVVRNRIKKSETDSKSSAFGYYNLTTQKIYLTSLDTLIEQGYKKGHYNYVIIHEYIHYVFFKEVDKFLEYDYIPTWFSEGVSDYLIDVSQETTTIEDTYKYVEGIKDDENFNSENAIEYYIASSYIIKYMHNKGGDDFIIKILSDMAVTKDIYISIENVFGETFEEIEAKVLVKE